METKQKDVSARQALAADRFRNHLNKSISANCAERYGKAISRFEVTATDYSHAWITAEIECLGLPESNLLRSVEHEFWTVKIGPRGALSAYQYPNSLEQFAGRKFMGINIVRSRGTHPRRASQVNV